MKLPKSVVIPDKAVFVPLGTRARLARAVLEPSAAPMYIARGSLISIQGSSDSNLVDNLKMKMSVQRPVSGVAGWNNILFDKLETTTPVSVILGKNKRNLSSLKLDGKFDYCLFNNTQIEGFQGTNLSISCVPQPKYISEALRSRYLKKEKVLGGLFEKKVEVLDKYTKTGLQPWKLYSKLSGRGDVLISTNSNVDLFAIELGPDEEVLIKRENLVAIKLNNELQDVVVKQGIKSEFSKAAQQQHEIAVSKPSQLSSYLQTLKTVFANIRGSLIRLVNEVSGDGYIKVIGPTQIVLKSGVSKDNLAKIKQLNQTPSIESVAKA